MERSFYPGIRAIDLKKLCDFYGFSVDEVLSLIIGGPEAIQETAAIAQLRRMWRAVERLAQRQQEFLVQALGVLLRGLENEEND
jgi:hypothetical protein